MKLRRSTFLSPADDFGHYIRLAQGLEGCAGQFAPGRKGDAVLAPKNQNIENNPMHRYKRSLAWMPRP
jgi:hypothetical protein